MTETEVIRVLQTLPALRVSVQHLENALSLLSPEDRLIMHYLVLYPQDNNIRQLCSRLHVEPCTIYRRRKRILRQLANTLECTERRGRVKN